MNYNIIFRLIFTRNNMNKQQLFENIKKKQSFLCVGLDTDIKKIPQHLLSEEDPIFAFNKSDYRRDSRITAWLINKPGPSMKVWA